MLANASLRLDWRQISIKCSQHEVVPTFFRKKKRILFSLGCHFLPFCLLPIRLLEFFKLEMLVLAPMCFFIFTFSKEFLKEVSVPQTGDHCLSHTINANHQHSPKYIMTSYSKEKNCWLIYYDSRFKPFFSSHKHLRMQFELI